MSDLEIIVEKLRALGLEDTKRVSEAVREHLEELDDIKVYDAAKASGGETEPLESVLKRYPNSSGA
jgi:hypothetical protein